MPSNAELGSQLSALKELMKLMPTKDDIKVLATKEDLENIVTKDDLEVFKTDFKREIMDDVDARFRAFDDKQKGMVDEKVKKEVDKIKAKRLLDEKYNFRCNFLLIAEPENDGAWNETPKDCLDIVNKYLAKFVPDMSDISIVDCHRYGKKKEGTNSITGKAFCRPIIFKVGNYFNVRKIWDNMPNLRKYFEENPTERKVFFRRHIPKQMHLQRLSLQPKFSKLYADREQPEWKLDAETAKYYIVTKNGAEIRQ